eukprot:scaffold176223_cov24-Tisochrysis_lutea.AAC.1
MVVGELYLALALGKRERELGWCGARVRRRKGKEGVALSAGEEFYLPYFLSSDQWQWRPLPRWE